MRDCLRAAVSAVAVLGLISTHIASANAAGALAIGLAVIMVGAINLKARKMHRGFTGDGGWELDFVILAANVALVLLGAGVWSLDNVLRI